LRRTGPITRRKINTERADTYLTITTTTDAIHRVQRSGSDTKVKPRLFLNVRKGVQREKTSLFERLWFFLQEKKKK